MLYAYEPFDLMVRETVELMDENDKLKLENAKLRDTTYAWRTVDRLSRENAKLRELLTDYYNAPCMICNPWAKEHRCKHDECGNCLLATRALELGIEVDG